MKTVLISIKVNSKIKKRAQALARELGFGLSTLLNAYLHQFIRDGQTFFSIEPQSRISKQGIGKIKKA